MASQLRAQDISMLDLRKVLAGHPRSETLFWQQNAHWRDVGKRLAMEAYLEMITLEMTTAAEVMRDRR